MEQQDLKKVTIHLKQSDVDELDLLLCSEYDACTIGENGRVTLYSSKACANARALMRNSLNTSAYAYQNYRNGRKLHGHHSLIGWHSTVAEKSETISNVKRSQIVWARHQSNRPYWPCYVVNEVDGKVHLFYISRTLFSQRTSPEICQKDKVIPYSSSTADSMMEKGLQYFRDNNLWKYFSDFYNSILLAKTYIIFKKRQFLTSEEEIFEFFNSDLPKIPLSDSFTPPCSIFVQKSRKRPSSYTSDTTIRIEKRKRVSNEQGPEHTSVTALDVDTIMEYILSGKCKKHLQRLLNGKFSCERWKTFKDGKLSFSALRIWRQININAFFDDEKQRDDVLLYLQRFVLNYQKRLSSKFRNLQFVRVLCDVVYPEAVVEAISKVLGKCYTDADEIYRRKQLSVDLNDKAFNKRLSSKEERLMICRIMRHDV